MTGLPKARTKSFSIVFGFLAFILVVIIGLLFYRAMTGRSLGIIGFAKNIAFNTKSQLNVVANAGKISAHPKGPYSNILFVHHSVGMGIINEGHLRDYFQKAGYAFFDQGYWVDGLHGPNGQSLNLTYAVPRDNTDPDGLYELFTQPLLPSPINGFSQVMQHDVIMIKSCYPISNIQSDQQFSEYQRYYEGIRDVMQKHPSKLLIILTQPPLIPSETTSEAASRARKLANWLKSDAFLNGVQNIKTFDLFDVLAEPDQQKDDANMLRAGFRNGADSHPNPQGSQTAAPLLANFVIEEIQTFQSSGAE